MWFYLAVPAFIIGSILIIYGGQNYPYIPLSVLVITGTIFYIWRVFYRRKQKKEVKNSSSTPMKIKKRTKSIKVHNKRDSDIAFLKKG